MLRMAHNHGHALDLTYEVTEKGERILVRSIEANQRAYLRFTNKTSRPVDVWWRDYRGTKRFYVRLDAGAHYDINSFITHPWEFTDSCTKEAYVINNNRIYRPPQNIGNMMYRTNWNITISVRSLQATALLSLSSYFSDPQQVEELGLPRILISELQQLIRDLHRTPSPVPPQ